MGAEMANNLYLGLSQEDINCDKVTPLCLKCIAQSLETSIIRLQTIRYKSGDAVLTALKVERSNGPMNWINAALAVTTTIAVNPYRKKHLERICTGVILTISTIGRVMSDNGLVGGTPYPPVRY